MSFCFPFKSFKYQMSLSVFIKTNNRIKPEELLRAHTSFGHDVVAPENEFPVMRIGMPDESVCGVEIEEETDGYDVRVYTLSSAVDYFLFAATIESITNLTGGRYYEEGYHLEPVSERAIDHFDEQWCEEQCKVSFENVKEIIRESGNPFIMKGLFVTMCVGPKLMKDLDIDLYDEYDEDDWETLQEHLCDLQWRLAEAMDTSTDILFSDDDDDDRGERMTLSLLCIENNEVRPFDYISYADVLCFLDTDHDEQVVIPFTDAWKTLQLDAMTLVDDCQIELLEDEEATTKMVRQMMEIAKYFEVPNLRKKYLYPGTGFDPEQRTFILMWNPEISSVTMDDHTCTIRHMLATYYNWSVWEHDKARRGDKFYLVCCAGARTGIVMSGIFDSNPWESEDWSGSGRQTFYMDMSPNVILDPEKAPMITTEMLEKEIPTFNWRGGHSGRLLTREEAEALESIWEKFMKEHAHGLDRDVLNMALCR